MEGIVTKLFNVDDVVFPNEMFQTTIDEAQIEEQVALLSLKYAKETEVNTASEQDVVFCTADKQSYPDGRVILLYTRAPLPYAEEASKEAVGKSMGDTFETVLCGNRVALTVSKIIHRVPVLLTDDIIASMGIEDVTTIDAYKEYLRNQQIEEQKSQQIRSASQYALGVMVENSEFLYNRADMELYVQSQLDQYVAECEKFGMEMDLNMVRQGAMSQAKQGWLAKAYCEQNGIELNLTSLEQQADEMMQMQMLMGAESMDRDSCIAMFTENQYLSKLFEAIHLKIQSVMED